MCLFRRPCPKHEAAPANHMRRRGKNLLVDYFLVKKAQLLFLYIGMDYLYAQEAQESSRECGTNCQSIKIPVRFIAEGRTH